MTAKESITKHEGKKNKVYLDNALPPKRTIGVGWNMDANPLPAPIQSYLDEHGEITEEMIDSLLELSIDVATKDCFKLFPDFNGFSENRRMALTDISFQLGYKRLHGFVNTIAAINTGRWDDAANEMMDSAWYRQVPNRAKEIVGLIREG